MPIYKSIGPDGTTVYSQSRPTSGKYQEVGPSGRKTERDAEHDHAQARKLISETRKRVPKLREYFEYLSYLRHHSPLRFDEALRDLKRSDPQAWMALQKHPQFRPLRETAIGLKAANRNLAAGIGFASGNFTGTVEKWLESTVKNLMKRDRFGSYSDVPKASSARQMDTARAAVRSSAATAFTRVGNPLIDLGVGALDPEVFRGVSAIQGMRLGKKLVEDGTLMPEEALELRGMMARGEFAEARSLIESGLERARKNP